MVQEIQPKIRVIQKAVFETETAKQAIFDNVSVIEQRLIPNVPSDSEVNKKTVYKIFQYFCFYKIFKEFKINFLGCHKNSNRDLRSAT